MLAMCAALLAAAVFLVLSSATSMPVSTTHAVIGAVVGVTGAGTSFSCLDLSKLLSIVASWVTSPLLAGAIGAGLHVALKYWIITPPGVTNSLQPAAEDVSTFATSLHTVPQSGISGFFALAVAGITVLQTADHDSQNSAQQRQTVQLLKECSHDKSADADQRALRACPVLVAVTLASMTALVMVRSPLTAQVNIWLSLLITVLVGGLAFILAYYYLVPHIRGRLVSAQVDSKYATKTSLGAFSLRPGQTDSAVLDSTECMQSGGAARDSCATKWALTVPCPNK
jgi:phosphate/sulfate permease